MANQLKMAKIDAILALHQRKWSIRRIAKELGIHRDTVARHLEAGTQNLGLAKVCSDGAEAKPATPGEGAQAAKPATPEGGAQEVKLGQAPIGSGPIISAADLPVCAAVSEPSPRLQARQAS